jgi:4-hydroxy-tetrahydrodipicolinate synthase
LVEPDTIKRLADVPNIVGVKDATGDVAMAVTISRETPDDFSLYSGEDGLNLRLAQEAGAVGTVSVASHWAGLIMGTMYEALADNDLSRAEQVNEYLEPSYAFESGAETPNPIPSKAILRGLGLAVGYCRPPMIPKKLDDQWRAVEADLEHRGVQIHQELMEAMAA